MRRRDSGSDNEWKGEKEREKQKKIYGKRRDGKREKKSDGKYLR